MLVSCNAHVALQVLRVSQGGFYISYCKCSQYCGKGRPHRHLAKCGDPDLIRHWKSSIAMLAEDMWGAR